MSFTVIPFSFNDLEEVKAPRLFKNGQLLPLNVLHYTLLIELPTTRWDNRLLCDGDWTLHLKDNDHPRYAGKRFCYLLQ